MAETGESDARERPGVRERWDSRRGFQRHSITLQVATTGVNDPKRDRQAKDMILRGYIYFSGLRDRFLVTPCPISPLLHHPMAHTAHCGMDSLLVAVIHLIVPKSHSRSE